MEYHLRLSIEKTNALILLNAFCASFNVIEIVSCFEFTKIEEDGTMINPHTHSYVKYGKVPTKQSISAFFKKWKQFLLKPKKETAGYSHKIQKKGTEENIVYTIKCGDYLQNTLGEDAIRKYKDKTEVINISKTMTSRDKIYHEWLLKKGLCYPRSKFEIFEFIDRLYVINWKRSPLAYGHKVCYSINLLMSIDENIIEKDINRYKTLLHSLYNIKEEDTQFSEYTETKVAKPFNILKLGKNKYIEEDENVEYISDDDDNDIIVDF